MKCLLIVRYLQLPNMNNPAVFIKEPLTFKNKFKVYPPSVRDVVGNPKFTQFLKILTISQEDI